MKFKITHIENGRLKTTIKSATSREKLERSALAIVKIEEILESSSKFKISQNHIREIFTQVAMLLEANLALDFICTHLAQSYEKNKHIKSAFTLALQKLESGENLYQSFSHFPLLKIHHAMLKIAQNSGEISRAFRDISLDIQNRQASGKKLQKALFYPVFVLISIIVAFFVGVSFVIPQFKGLFLESNAPLPFVTQILLWIEIFLKEYSIMAFLALASTILGLKIARGKNSKIAQSLDAMVLKIPALSKITLYSTNERYFYALHMLLDAGVHLELALQLSSSTITNTAISKETDIFEQRIKAGDGIYQGLKDASFIDSASKMMIKSAESSGALNDTLLSISKRYGELSADYTSKILLLVEPGLNVLMALLVLLLALGIFMPIWGLQDTL